MTSNIVLVTYERSSKSNPLADAYFRAEFHLASACEWPDRSLFESVHVQAHLNFFPFENITKVMKFDILLVVKHVLIFWL